MAVTRVEDRVYNAFGLSQEVELQFESCQSIPMGGVLIMLPFLLECGLLSYRSHYSQREGYYSFDSLLITLAFLALLRIRSIEQSKQCNPGELGKLIGYDRIPEVKKLRSMLRELTNQNKVSEWANSLSNNWINEECPELFYVDGHVQIYHGQLAELGKKHVSRQRLCLPGMLEFWVNSPQGLPFFVITAQVNEKMIEMLENEIIPHLIKNYSISPQQQQMMEENENYPLFTIVFDREGYSPSFFKHLWENYRIAVLTYRKNVKDQWEEAEFEEIKVETRLGEAEMLLHEKQLEIDGCSMREVRRLCTNNHQTSIITTNQILNIALIATHMFGRWIQENFFRYMRQEYALDRIIQYAIDEIDINIVVVNREYSNIQYEIKKEREKLGRIKAKFYDHQNKNNDENPTKKLSENWMVKQLEYQEQITQKQEYIDKLILKRKTIPYKIPIGKMPVENRYTKLHQESKLFNNIIKMICYRAETALANLLVPHYKRSDHEIRALVKAVINQTIDLIPDYKENTLNITIYSLSNNRSNQALSKIIDTINQQKTVYPNTNLVMNFKIKTI